MILGFKGNKYTGANFTNTPPPQLFDDSVLRLTQASAEKALDKILLYFEAFRKHLRDFRVKLIGVKPLLGDLKIVEKLTEQEVFVELKREFFYVEHNETSGLTVLRHQQMSESRKIFYWKAQWDYLLTANSAMIIAYMLPRDKILTAWWNASVPEDGFLEMSEGFQEYFIDLSHDFRIVGDIEKVLNAMRIRTGSMRARRAIPIDYSMYEPSDQIKDDAESDNLDLVSRQRWSTSGFRREFESAKYGELCGETYAVWVSEVLIESCRAR